MLLGTHSVLLNLMLFKFLVYMYISFLFKLEAIVIKYLYFRLMYKKSYIRKIKNLITRLLDIRKGIDKTNIKSPPNFRLIVAMCQ